MPLRSTCPPDCTVDSAHSAARAVAHFVVTGGARPSARVPVRALASSPWHLRCSKRPPERQHHAGCLPETERGVTRRVAKMNRSILKTAALLGAVAAALSATACGSDADSSEAGKTLNPTAGDDKTGEAQGAIITALGPVAVSNCIARAM